MPGGRHLEPRHARGARFCHHGQCHHQHRERRRLEQWHTTRCWGGGDRGELFLQRQFCLSGRRHCYKSLEQPHPHQLHVQRKLRRHWWGATQRRQYLRVPFDDDWQQRVCRRWCRHRIRLGVPGQLHRRWQHRLIHAAGYRLNRRHSYLQRRQPHRQRPGHFKRRNLAWHRPHRHHRCAARSTCRWARRQRRPHRHEGPPRWQPRHQQRPCRQHPRRHLRPRRRPRHHRADPL